MGEFTAPVDIANRALQLLGQPRISTLGDSNPCAAEAGFALPKVRRAELERNLWRCATRRVFLRAQDTTTRIVTFPNYASGTTYYGGALVTYGNKRWVSLIDSNTGNIPGVSPTTLEYKWASYYGPITATLYNAGNTSTSENLSYHIGEIVYTTPGDGTVLIYVSQAENNTNDPEEVDEWDEDVSYNSGDVVSEDGTNYQSLVNYNLDNTPSSSPTQWTSTVTNPTVSNSWLKITSATLAQNPIVYPLNAGPYSQVNTSNAYRLPNGYLRAAPSDPKADFIRVYGLPRWTLADWLFEGDFIVSEQRNDPILLRFVADLEDVTHMDDMLCEGIAARLALEIGPVLLREHWREFRPGVRQRYLDVIREARSVNAIEIGPISPEEDTYLTARL